MTVVDLVLLLWAVGALIHGWRLGIVRGLCGFLGMALGFWIGLQALPIALNAISMDTIGRVVSSMGLLLLLAGIGQALGGMVGEILRRTLALTPIRLVDAVLGSAFRVATWAVIVWLLGSVVALLPDRGLVGDIRGSQIVRAIDATAPDAADRATAALRSALRDSPFPQVFAGLTPSPGSSVPPPDEGILEDQAVRASFRSVYQVIADAPSCVTRSYGTAFVIADGRLITNAHVIAGANSVVVRSSPKAPRLKALVIFVDPDLDLAVLDAPDVKADPLTFAPQVPVGSPAAVPGFTAGEALSPDAARVSDVMLATGHDIYGEKRVRREVYVLRANIAPGDSGAPLLDGKGSVLGVIFAAGNEGAETGYALTARAVAATVAAAPRLRGPAGTGPCQP